MSNNYLCIADIQAVADVTAFVCSELKVREWIEESPKIKTNQETTCPNGIRA